MKKKRETYWDFTPGNYLNRFLIRKPGGRHIDPEVQLQNIDKAQQKIANAYFKLCFTKKGMPLKNFMDNLEKYILVDMLTATQGNQKAAAAILRIKPTTLHEKMRKYGIKSSDIKNLEMVDFGSILNEEEA